MARFNHIVQKDQKFHRKFYVSILLNFCPKYEMSKMLNFRPSNFCPIQEEGVLESLCETTNIEVYNIKGSTVSHHERQKLINKFQSHSKTENIFESEQNLNKFMTDLYDYSNNRESEISLYVPNVRSNSMMAVRRSQNSVTSLGSRQSLQSVRGK